MSADELGKRLGKDRSTIYRYEKGEIENLPLDILEPIAKALNTSPQYLMGWDEIDREETQKKMGTVADAAHKMKADPDFLEAVKLLLEFDRKKKIKDVLNLLRLFLKQLQDQF
jgi:transcriptional regulator with XRE-family HTH domain